MIVKDALCFSRWGHEINTNELFQTFCRNKRQWNIYTIITQFVLEQNKWKPCCSVLKKKFLHTWHRLPIKYVALNLYLWKLLYRSNKLNKTINANQTIFKQIVQCFECMLRCLIIFSHNWIKWRKIHLFSFAPLQSHSDYLWMHSNQTPKSCAKSTRNGKWVQRAKRIWWVLDLSRQNLIYVNTVKTWNFCSLILPSSISRCLLFSRSMW